MADLYHVILKDYQNSGYVWNEFYCPDCLKDLATNSEHLKILNQNIATPQYLSRLYPPLMNEPHCREAVIGKCRESNQRDLYYSIEKGEFPRWTLSVQIMTEQQAAKHPYNPFDLTKVWYKKDFPLIEVGVMELNKNPENYFAEVEQSAFNPANVVPGIGFSPDKMLQGRLFSYGDTQRYRLGVNHHLIPVNKARCPFHSYHRDGQMRVDGNYGSMLGYEPNSYGEWQEQPDFSEPPLELSGAAAHWNAREDDSDYYTQPGKLFSLMNKEQQEALFGNTARAMDDVPEMIKIRHISNCLKADPAYGEGVADALGIPLDKVPK